MFFFNNLFKFNLPSEKYLLNLKIDLSKINFFLKKKYIQNKKKFLWYGDWDKKKISIDKYGNTSINYYSVFEIFRFNKNFKESKEYQKKLNELNLKGFSSRGHRNIKELDDYFVSLINLKNSIEKYGYKSQLQLNNINQNDEIGVVIGRNGEIIKLEDKFGGTHRFAICKVLNIKSVLISIKAIHSNFADKIEIQKIISNADCSNIINNLKEKIYKFYE